MYEDSVAFKKMHNAKKILDVGCGVGRFIENDPKRIVGIDHNEKSIAVCKRKGYEVYTGNVTKMLFDDDSFDAVHCSHVIEHLMPVDALKMLSEIARVTKVGGLICIRTPLLHGGFYNDFSHIKPYNPEAILHYMKSNNKHGQPTLSTINGTYELKYLKYRHALLFKFPFSTNKWIHRLNIIPVILYRVHIRSWHRTGYMLILKKK